MTSLAPGGKLGSAHGGAPDVRANVRELLARKHLRPTGHALGRSHGAAYVLRNPRAMRATNETLLPPGSLV